MSITIVSSKAARIRNALHNNPDATSSELAKAVGCDPAYVRAALKRSDLATRYRSGLSRGGRPLVKGN